MQITQAVIITTHLVFGHFEQMMPPPRRLRNWKAPPGIWRYCVPRVSNPNEPTMIEVNCVKAVFGT